LTSRSNNILKRKKYHTIRTVPKSNKKIIETLVKLMHIYMTSHLPGLVQALQLKVVELN
jgi:hypothetical protein